MSTPKRRSRAWISECFAAMETEARRLEMENAGRTFTPTFGSNIHRFLNEWVIGHPATENDFLATYPILKSWKESRKPSISKSIKSGFQGVIAFYDPDDHLVIDAEGTTVRFEVATLEQFDSWWEVQRGEKDLQDKAFDRKAAIRDEIRGYMTDVRGARPRVGIVMEDVFHWSKLRGGDGNGPQNGPQPSAD